MADIGFLHMSFGLKMSWDVFQMQMDQATDHLPAIITILDDICVFGLTPEEHDEHLLYLMQSAKDHGIVFHGAKCHTRQPQIAFYGAVFIAQGMQPDPSKIQAFQDLPTPDSLTKLQSFLGLINYLQPFIPGLSTKTVFLWEQLAERDWNLSTDAVFQHLKVWICQTLLKVTLAYYDWSKPVVVQTDASEYGLGTTLIQGSCPIAFASKSLTDVGAHYANIEECLSVCFGLEKFHTYLYGRHVIVENEHKPLEMIQHKSIHVALPRLWQMLLHMKKYDYTIWYQPGKDMVLADHLSCFPSTSNSLPIPLAHNIQHVQLSNADLDITWGSVKHDLVYSTIYCLTLRGWPKHRQDIPHIAQHF